MDPKELPEEHRKYLEMSNNPKRPTNTSIFALLSDVRVAIGKMETKQENIEKSIGYVDKKIEKLDDSMNHKIDVLEDDFKGCQLEGIGSRGKVDERFSWQDRMQKVIISLVIFSISLILYLHFGISFP